MQKSAQTTAQLNEFAFGLWDKKGQEKFNGRRQQ